jgi:DHA1 family bicyclomycin/chloramphenicol resistance-like MFS transporter
MIGLAVGQVIAGPLSDRLGRKRPLVVGLAAFVLLSVACALAPSIEWVVALRLIQGAAGGTSIVIARSIVRDTYGVQGAARAFSLLVMAAGLAPIISPVLGGFLLMATSWRGLFAFLAVLTSGLLLAAVLGIRETLPMDQRHSGGLRRLMGQAGLVYADRFFVVATAIQCLSGAGMFTFISMSSFVFQGNYGFEAQEFGLLFGGISVGIVTAARVNAWAVGRFHLASVMRWGVTSSLLGALGQAVTVLLGGPVWLVSAFVFVAIASGGLVNPNCQAIALRNQQQRTGTASGLLGLMQFGLGAAIGPLVSLAGATPAVMSITMACTATLMAVAYTAGRKRLRTA